MLCDHLEGWDREGVCVLVGSKTVILSWERKKFRIIFVAFSSYV